MVCLPDEIFPEIPTATAFGAVFLEPVFLGAE